MTTAAAAHQREFDRWKTRVLISYAAFYLTVYTARFNHWPAAPLMREDLGFSHVEIGLINAVLLWGFAIGDITHGRLAEAYGFRLWILIGSVASVALNWVTSFGTNLWTIALPWAFNGFFNAVVWSPGVSLITQWWPRSQRGRAMGVIGIGAGGAMLIMWTISGYAASEWGWRAAFRYPPLMILPAAIVLYFLARDRPSDVRLPGTDETLADYEETNVDTAAREARTGDQKLSWLAPYRILMTDWRFVTAAHVKGLENVMRYGLTTWAPIYYFEEAGISIESTVLVTVALPIGLLAAPLTSGYITDKLLGGMRSPMQAASAIISAAALLGLAFAPASNLWLGAALLFIGGFAMNLSTSAVLAIDLAGRRIAATASGVLDGHGYLYAGAQAIILAVVLDVSGSPWPIVFLTMAAARLISAAAAWRIRF